MANQQTVLTGVTLICIGCGAPPLPDLLPDLMSTGLSFEAFKARTFRHGASGVYVVDGDLPVATEQELREFYDSYVRPGASAPSAPRSGALIVHRAGGLDARWYGGQQTDLSYCVSTAFGSRHGAVVQALESAAQAWQAAAHVRFVYRSGENSACTETNGRVVFDVQPTSAGQFLASAFFPNFTRGQRTLWIDSTAFTVRAPITLPGILRHEIGHALGFRHEHTRPEAGARTCFEDSSWRPLTPYDPASVMHYPQCQGSNRGDLDLTQMDRNGVALLYGAPMPTPTPPTPPTPGSGTAIACNWSGSKWISHGWDKDCAWRVGMFVHCADAQVTRIEFGSWRGCGEWSAGP